MSLFRSDTTPTISPLGYLPITSWTACIDTAWGGHSQSYYRKIALAVKNVCLLAFCEGVIDHPLFGLFKIDRGERSPAQSLGQGFFGQDKTSQIRGWRNRTGTCPQPFLIHLLHRHSLLRHDESAQGASCEGWWRDYVAKIQKAKNKHPLSGKILHHAYYFAWCISFGWTRNTFTEYQLWGLSFPLESPATENWDCHFLDRTCRTAHLCHIDTHGEWSTYWNGE